MIALRTYLMIIVALSIITACQFTTGREKGKTPNPRRWLVEDSVIIDDVDFVNHTSDTIIDPKGSMNRFYQRLYHLSEEVEVDGVQVNVLHYGDSHIQAGDITGIVMRRLQHRFGNAGRGLIVPHRITRSNSAQDYRISTPNSFTTTRMNSKLMETTIGIGGVGLQSDDNQQQFQLQVFNKDTMDYSFKHLVVFHDPKSPIVTAKEELLSEFNGDQSQYDFITEIDLKEKTDTLLLYTYKQKEYDQGAFYGFSLENGKSGILYHAMGVNGACFLHWGRNRDGIKQSRALSPELIIVSMGTNEAAGRNFIESVFYREVDDFISQLRAANPKSAILLTIPAEGMRRAKRVTTPNKNFEKVRSTLLRYGAEKGVAVFDLYQATGGSGSSQSWMDAKLMQRDGIHFTQRGYQIQGLLIYGAILNGYIGWNR